MNRIDLVLTNELTEVKSLLLRGFCPVECALGSESVVGELKMDHHGEHDHLEGVALRAYRDHFGARSDDPRFVGVGSADADMTFAIAALAGLLPHPSRKEGRGQDLINLARTINALDTDPVGRDITRMTHGALVQTWKDMMVKDKDTLGMYTGVGLWVNLTNAGNHWLDMYFDAARDSERQRITQAKEVLRSQSEEVSSDVLFVWNSPVWGFDVWYGRKSHATDPQEVASWGNPIVVTFSESKKKVSIGVPNEAVAQDLFGGDGLMGLTSTLDAEIMSGWGGRQTIIGSPRGKELTREQAKRAAQIAASHAR